MQKYQLDSVYEDHKVIFSSCRRILGTKTWGRVLTALEEGSTPRNFPDELISIDIGYDLPAYISDLARLEWKLKRAKEKKSPFNQKLESIAVNPSLTLLPVSWKNLVGLLEPDSPKENPMPEPFPSHVMIWHHPKTGVLHIREAEDIDLLALKITIEKIDPRVAASTGNVHVRAIQSALDGAIAQGFLMSPGSRIQRFSLKPLQASDPFYPFLTAKTFTLQWHITQACDLHCRHCYDRSDRTPVSHETAISILDEFYDFCLQMHVKGQVTFTGGNPMLHPNFVDIYKAAFDRGFCVAILGNPTPVEKIERLLHIVKPLFFQISLEGLSEYNDYIRGDGHFKRSLVFLDQLCHLGIYTMVMLTLTRDNLNQVLSLARLLENRADYFTFNRLATVGEGANLMMPLKEDFETFLREYESEAKKLSVLGLKDNLINIIREEKGVQPFGGCTGYGCGAAFNFVALLPDGEVHACRKFPSLIGNIGETKLIDIYLSDIAQRYRSGSEACGNCSLYAVCRGCFAVTYSHGLDIFKGRDPFCFKYE